MVLEFKDNIVYLRYQHDSEKSLLLNGPAIQNQYTTFICYYSKNVETIPGKKIYHQTNQTERNLSRTHLVPSVPLHIEEADVNIKADNSSKCFKH